MDHPFNYWSPPTSARIFLIALIMTNVFLVVLGILGRPTVNKKMVKNGMMSFQFAGTAKRSQRIVDSWDGDARTRAFRSLMIDFVFIIAYVATLSFACLMAHKFFDGQDWTVLSCLALLLAWGQLGAGLLDAVENVSLMHILHRVNGEKPFYWFCPGVAACCAGLKFTLIGLGCTCVFTAVIFSLAPKLGSS